jgi:hypothetical protein
VAGLLGRWVGDGTGRYPTIDDFCFHEELVFGHAGKPFLSYAQRTWSPEGAPLHVESGYLRLTGEGRAEFTVAQPTGVTEVHEGTVRVVADHAVDVVEIDMTSAAIGLTATAKPMTVVHRRFRLTDQQLDVTLDMAAVGRELSAHLESRLTRD